MNFAIISIFPDFCYEFLETGIIAKAQKKKKINCQIYNPRDFSKYKNKNIDDKPYGGMQGQLMLAQPLINTIKHVKNEQNYKNGKLVYLSPKGKKLDQNLAKNFAKSQESMILLCGRYEGIDQRVIDKYVDFELSIGDYILTGGEVGAFAVIEATARLVCGVLGNKKSALDDSFSNQNLEYPQYTKPQQIADMKVPDILLSGNTKEIKKWQIENSINLKNKK